MKKFSLDVIPKNTDYCYERNAPARTVNCPYWHKKENGAYCEFLNSYSEEYDSSNLIWDQVKECGVNLPDEEEEKEDE